jgi:hypothetical protein
MIAHALEVCPECEHLRDLIRRAHPEADMGARFARWCEVVLEDRPSHAAEIETDFFLQERAMETGG